MLCSLTLPGAKAQTSVKTEEVVKEGFDKLMTKMSDQLGSLQTKASTAQMPAPKEPVQTRRLRAHR